MAELPALFIQRLRDILSSSSFDSVLKSFYASRILSGRVNTLKTDVNFVWDFFRKHHVAFVSIPWYPEAFVIEDLTQEEFSCLDLVREGRIYQQSLSSMLPVLILDPKPGERVLDMCAAPGSKATQMAALMKNEGEIICLEKVRKRYYKLKSVIELLGAQNIHSYCLDARWFKAKDLFDKILVDAPCSSEGRFKTEDPKTSAFWSFRKIKELQRKQRGLLLGGLRLLKKGGELIYATCTFAPEENEEVVDWALKKMDGHCRLLLFELPGVDTYPILARWQNKTFSPSLSAAKRIFPNGRMEGFFIAKFVKKVN